MFTLRTIYADGLQGNFILGEDYTFSRKIENNNEFRKNFAIYFKKEYPKEKDSTEKDLSFEGENCYGFVGNKKHLQPLYKNQKNFIMTSDGKTFDNLSYK